MTPAFGPELRGRGKTAYTNVDSSDMEVAVELGVPGASDGVMGSVFGGGRLMRVG